MYVCSRRGPACPVSVWIDGADVRCMVYGVRVGTCDEDYGGFGAGVDVGSSGRGPSRSVLVPVVRCLLVPQAAGVVGGWGAPSTMRIWGASVRRSALTSIWDRGRPVVAATGRREGNEGGRRKDGRRKGRREGRRKGRRGRRDTASLAPPTSRCWRRKIGAHPHALGPDLSCQRRARALARATGRQTGGRTRLMKIFGCPSGPEPGRSNERAGA